MMARRGVFNAAAMPAAVAICPSMPASPLLEKMSVGFWGKKKRSASRIGMLLLNKERPTVRKLGAEASHHIRFRKGMRDRKLVRQILFDDSVQRLKSLQPARVCITKDLHRLAEKRAGSA